MSTSSVVTPPCRRLRRFRLRMGTLRSPSLGSGDPRRNGTLATRVDAEPSVAETGADLSRRSRDRSGAWGWKAVTGLVQTQPDLSDLTSVPPSQGCCPSVTALPFHRVLGSSPGSL